MANTAAQSKAIADLANGKQGEKQKKEIISSINNINSKILSAAMKGEYSLSTEVSFDLVEDTDNDITKYYTDLGYEVQSDISYHSMTEKVNTLTISWENPLDAIDDEEFDYEDVEIIISHLGSHGMHTGKTIGEGPWLYNHCTNEKNGTYFYEDIDDTIHDIDNAVHSHS